MKLRSFTRKKMKGVMTADQTLRHLYCSGPKTAKYPDHPVIKTMLKKGYITMEMDMCEITEAGSDAILKHHPNLKSFAEYEAEKEAETDDA